MIYRYYNRTFDTVLTDTDEIIRYHYNNIFFSDDILTILEPESVGIEYVESKNNMIVDSGTYRESITDIVHDLTLVKDCTIVSVNGFDINNRWYTPDEIINFIRIISDNTDDDICVDFIFGDIHNKSRNKCKIFSVYC